MPILLLAVFTILRVADRPVTDVANDFEHLTPFLLPGFLLSLFLAWNNQSLLRSAFAFHVCAEADSNSHADTACAPRYGIYRFQSQLLE